MNYDFNPAPFTLHRSPFILNQRKTPEDIAW